MKGKTKLVTYLVVVAWAVFFGYEYAHAHTLLSQPGGAASKSAATAYLSLFILGLVGVAAICVYELIWFFKNRAERWIVQGAIASGPAPELEAAERLRAAGRPLDAIGAMREYLQLHPYELQVMARIAEIYRYDLNNDLAAALEYEELLKHKLPDDQWSWAALHLAKLYGRRNELDKSLALLERLDTEYGHTVAGGRAKKALEQVRNPEGQVNQGEEAEEESG